MILLFQQMAKLLKILAATCSSIIFKAWEQIFENDYYGFKKGD